MDVICLSLYIFLLLRFYSVSVERRSDKRTYIVNCVKTLFEVIVLNVKYYLVIKMIFIKLVFFFIFTNKFLILY